MVCLQGNTPRSTFKQMINDSPQLHVLVIHQYYRDWWCVTTATHDWCDKLEWNAYFVMKVYSRPDCKPPHTSLPLHCLCDLNIGRLTASSLGLIKSMTHPIIHQGVSKQHKAWYKSICCLMSFRHLSIWSAASSGNIMCVCVEVNHSNTKV